MVPAIFGFKGLSLSEAERSFFRSARPIGYILFSRNISHREQVRALTDSLRDLHGRDDLLVLVDQEGGRVARLSSPEWREYPSAAALASGWAKRPAVTRELVELNYEAMALDLVNLGINVTCAPVLDVVDKTDDAVIGDRAFGTDPVQVAALGTACLNGLQRGGVRGVIKHLPGHGRTRTDSHRKLPVVEAQTELLERDLLPFQQMSDAFMGMTAHVCYPQWDAERCATLSAGIIRDVIRQQIGFDGLLLTDDLDMQALQGSIPERALAALTAGCDVALNCWAKIDDMEAVAAALPSASEQCLARLGRATAGLRLHSAGPNMALRQRELIASRDRLLALGQAVSSGEKRRGSS